MQLVLVTKTPIIEKIFSLVCRKLDINIIIKDNLYIKDEVDFLIIDEEFINDDFNSLKQKTKKIAAISSIELSFDKSRDFIVKRPFLPTNLEAILKDQITLLNNENRREKEFEENSKSINKNINVESEESYEDYEDDESIVNKSLSNLGGILDSFELSKINYILNDDAQNKSQIDDNDWNDINEIIDDALEDVNKFEYDINNENKAVKINLNNYNIKELKPFLQKFDQNLLDRLSKGEDVDITLSLKVNN